MREVRQFEVSEASAELTLAKFHKIANRGKSKGLEGGFTVLGIADKVQKDPETGIEYVYKVIELKAVTSISILLPVSAYCSVL